MRRLAFLLFSLSLPIFAQNKSADEIKAAVTRMARVGRCGSPSFSPDGKTLAVVCDMGENTGTDGTFPDFFVPAAVTSAASLS